MSLKAIWARFPPPFKFSLTIVVALAGAFLFTGVAGMYAAIANGIDPEGLEEFLTHLDNPLAVSILKMLQVVAVIGTFILPAFLLGYLFSGSSSRYLHLDRKVSLVSAVLVFVLLIFSIPLINFLGELNARLDLPSWMSRVEEAIRNSEESAAAITEKFIEINSTGQLIYAIILMALLPALGEELMFRGVLQRIFSEWSGSRHTGIWATAILFSAIHMQFYGFVPRMLLGALLGYLFLWSGSLWLPILGHFFNNASAVIAIYFFRKGEISLDPDRVGAEGDFTSLVISVALTSILIVALYWRRQREELVNEDQTDIENKDSL